MHLTLPLLMFTLFTSCEPGAACDCTVTINGTTRTSKLCGEKLCFADGSAFECTTEGSREVSSCNGGSGGGGGSASGGGSATGGGGGAATGGGSASGGGTGGGSATGGGGGGSSGPSCVGTFSCGSITCNAATELCNTTYTPARCVANTSACRNSGSYCISATAVTTCMGGKRFSCSADSATGGVTAGCQ